MSNESTLLALEEEVWRANREGDGGFYQKHLRDDAIAVSKYGTIDKSQAVGLIGANVNPYLSTELSDKRVLMLTPDSAVVTYKARVVAEVAGEETTFEVLASTIYARASSDDAWAVVFHQQTSL